MTQSNTPLVMFGSYNERMYLAECATGPMRPTYIPASFPGAVIRRHTGTPFMGYAGATYIIQEFCNALFDALFHILPLASDMDKIEPTVAKQMGEQRVVWESEASEKLAALIESDPVLVQISSAKRLRDRAERDAKRAGESIVTADRVSKARQALAQGEPA